MRNDTRANGHHRGRPPRAEAASEKISTRLSPSERSRVIEAARQNHQTLSEFQRDACLDRADQTLPDRS